MGFFSIFLLFASLVVVLAPIFARGLGAFIFRGTVEFRRLNFEQFNRGSKERIDREKEISISSRQVVYDLIADFEKQIENQDSRFVLFLQRLVGIPMADCE